MRRCREEFPLVCLSGRVIAPQSQEVVQILHDIKVHRPGRETTANTFSVKQTRKGHYPWIILLSASVKCNKTHTHTWISHIWSPWKRHICTWGHRAGRHDWPESTAGGSPGRRSEQGWEGERDWNNFLFCFFKCRFSTLDADTKWREPLAQMRVEPAVLKPFQAQSHRQKHTWPKVKQKGYFICKISRVKSK